MSNIFEKLRQGDEVVVADTSFGKTKRKLIFDRTVYWNDYGENLNQIIFQKTKEDLGRKDIAIVYSKLKEIRIESVNDMSVKDFEKSLKGKHKDIETLEDTDEPKKIHTNFDFEITKKDGRFYCPCGNSYSQKGNAIKNHKTHLVKG